MMLKSKMLAGGAKGKMETEVPKYLNRFIFSLAHAQHGFKP